MKKKISEIRMESIENIRKNGLFSVLIIFLAALICAGLLFFNFFFSNLYIIIVPLFVLPLMFAAQQACFALRKDGNLTFASFISGYPLYFTERFRSTYSFWKTAAKLIIIYAVVSVVSVIVINLSFYYSNFLGTKDIFDDILINVNSVDAIDGYISEHQSYFDILILANRLPALIAISIAGLHYFSVFGHSFFLRMTPAKYPGNYFRSLFLRFLRENRKGFYRVYFLLNWPLYLLFIVGFGLGGYIGSIYQVEINAIFTFGLVFAFLFAFAGYGFVYFANKEAVYNAFVHDLEESNHKFITEIASRFSNMTIEEVEKKLEEPEIEEENENIDE